MVKLFKKAMLAGMAVMLCVMVIGCSSDSDGEQGSGEAGGEVVENAEELARVEVDKGIELVSTGDYEGSLPHFQKALKYDDKNPKAWCAMGTALRQVDRWEESVEYYKKAIELKPDYFICQDNMGLSYMYMQEFDNAIDAYKKAIEMNPNYPNAYFNLGTLYYEGLGDNENAAIYFEKYITLSTDHEMVEEVKGILTSME